MAKAKPPKRPSMQEEILGAFARSSFSAAGVFHPKQWGNGKEPADLLLCIGRSLFMFNMYEGKSWLEQACFHNLNQLRDRIADWKNGPSIKGANEFATFDIGWDDIDQIAVVSVIDGPHAACLAHPREIVGHSEKVACAYTITGKALLSLANDGIGARELIFLAAFLRQQVSPLASDQIVSALLGRQALAYMQYNLALPTLKLPRPFIVKGRGVAMFDYIRQSLFALRRQGMAGPTELFCELDWFDVGFIAAEVTKMVSAIENVPKGATGPRFALLQRANGEWKFGVAIAAHSGIMKEQTSAIMTAMDQNNWAFTYLVSLDNGQYISMFAAKPDQIHSRIAFELSQLREP